MKKLFITFLGALSVLSFSSFVPPVKPKNIILLIGDGNGLTQISYGLLTAKYQLNYERFKQLGLIKTASSDSRVTDSAAGATAFACGKKTYNGAIGVDSTKKSVKSILEMAEEQGLATGMVVTSSITHATPASFIAHQPNREMGEEIAADFLKTPIDVFIGGGLDHFTKRKDGQDLTEELKKKGYELILKPDLVGSAQSTQIAALLAPNHLNKAEDRGDFLPFAAGKAMSVLSQNPKGFFLMIEGSQIDFGGHENNVDYVRSELLDFDKAIGIALDFAEKDGNTLVIVTADHETGGLTLPGKDQPYQAKEFNPRFSTKDHTGCLIPVFAFGPGAEAFGGIYFNTAIFEKMRQAYGW